ncbi:Crp/Fnr family transcriptional regulator [Ancylobacter terrae]|uniref:Crp/Fnr family transcriptional regulator n=1 Tax=Ancylobacter sp. sgz301288 TaxID=3342077 RepID=UPI00385EC8B4
MAAPAGPDEAPQTLLAALPAALKAHLFAGSRPVSLEAGRSLFEAGDPADGCYRIESGLLKVSVLSAAGNERILAILGPGALVGELALLDGRPRSASVAALRDSTLAFIGRNAFDAVLAREPDLWRLVAAMLATRLRDANESLAASSFLPLQGRIARALLTLGEAFGEPVPPDGAGRLLIRQKLSQSDLAAIAGIARENVSRILNGWIREGLVSRLAGYYCLEKPAELEQLTRD